MKNILINNMQLSNSVICLNYFMGLLYLPQPVQDIKTTLFGCCYNITMVKQCCNNVILTSCAGWQWLFVGRKILYHYHISIYSVYHIRKLFIFRPRISNYGIKYPKLKVERCGACNQIT